MRCQGKLNYKSENVLGLFLQVKNVSFNNPNEILQRNIKLEY